VSLLFETWAFLTSTKVFVPWVVAHEHVPKLKVHCESPLLHCQLFIINFLPFSVLKFIALAEITAPFLESTTEQFSKYH
jgi:hypothetical protein